MPSPAFVPDARMDSPALVLAARTISARVSKPIRSGQAFVSIRSILPSPFADGRIYYGGYDCNFYPADGTAWVATSLRNSLRPSVPAKGTQS